MLPRGYRLHLDPGRYPAHAALAERLRARRGWTEEQPADPAAEPEQGPAAGSGPGLLPEQEAPLYPHQAALIERLRATSRS